MQTAPTRYRCLAYVVLLLACPLLAELQTPVPLDNLHDSADLLPPGIIYDQPEIDGAYVHVWALAPATQVIQYHGDFELSVGLRTISSQDAVVWMTRVNDSETAFYRYEAFLSRNASVKDSAGTVTSGPFLFVTFNCTQPAVVNADVHTTQPSDETDLYQQALETRASAEKPPGAGAAEGMKIVEPTPPDADQAQPKAAVRFVAKRNFIADQKKGILTTVGDVYVSQSVPETGELLEIQADAAVIFLTTSASSGPDERASSPNAPPLEPVAGPGGNDPLSGSMNSAMGIGAGAPAQVSGVYLQGNVSLSRGSRRIQASELYYDFENDRAVILDAVMRAMAPGREVPIYVRADRVRQLSTTEYFARNAKITSSEFHTPHVHIGAERVKLTDLTPRDQRGNVIGLDAGTFEISHATLNVEGFPVAYWPYAAGSFRQSETSIRSVRVAYSDDFGATWQSQWYLFNLLGIQKPEGVDGTFRLDYFSERGPGVGTDLDYQLEDSFGLMRSYYIHDTGEDNLGPFRGGEPDTENRGRFTVRHRQYLPEDWELTLEASYISDPNFLEEYFNAEFEEGKDQETLMYLKKQEDNWAVTGLAQWRLLDYTTQTERLPDLGFHLVGEPLGDGLASFYNESHLGFVRYRPDDRRLFDRGRLIDNHKPSSSVLRGDTRNEVQIPIKATDISLNVVPYAVGRAGYWDDSPWDSSVDRMFGSAGVRTSGQLWKLLPDFESNLLDVHGLRHVIRPEITTWISGSNRSSYELYPFDVQVEDVDDFYGTSFAIRQQWQTKRGGGSRRGEEMPMRKVDWITWDVEVNVFGDAPEHERIPVGRFYPSRPENSVARNHVRSDFMYRISDTTTVLSDANVDLNDGDMDIFNLSYAVERTPRFSYFIGYRRIHDTDSDLLGLGTNYELNSKYRLATRYYFDVERSQTETFDITIVRRFPRWYAAVTFALDQVEDDFGLGLSLWPEGAPQAAIGSRKYTSLSESTGIRPQD